MHNSAPEILFSHIRKLEPIYQKALIVALGLELKDGVYLLHSKILVLGDVFPSFPTISVPSPLVLVSEIVNIETLKESIYSITRTEQLKVSEITFYLRGPGSSNPEWKLAGPPKDEASIPGKRGTGVRINLLGPQKINELVIKSERNVTSALRGHPNGPMDHMQDLLQRLFGEKIDHDLVIVSCITRTGVHIKTGWISEKQLHLTYEVPDSLKERVGIGVSIFTPDTFGAELYLSQVERSEDGEDLRLVKSVYDIKNYESIILTGDSILRLTLKDGQSGELLASREFPAQQLEQVIPTIGLFGRAQNYVHSRMESLDPETYFDFQKTINEHEQGHTRATPKIVALNLRTSIQQILDSIITEDMLQAGETFPEVERTRERLKIIL